MNYHRPTRSALRTLVWIVALLGATACTTLNVSTAEEDDATSSSPDTTVRPDPGVDTVGPGVDAKPTEDPVVCGDGTRLDEDSNECVPTGEPVTCGPDTALNPQTNQCEPTGEPVACGPGTALDPQTNECEPTDDPIVCGDGTQLNAETGECEPTGEPVTCGDGTELNPDTGQCEPTGEPVTCGDGTALNPTTGECEPTGEPVTCGPGTELNPATNVCERTADGGFQTCPSGYVPAASTGGVVVCEPVLPVTIYGFVTDAFTGEPIEGATVTFWPGPDDVLTTDAQGYFAVEAISVTGDLKVFVQLDGYGSAVVDLDVPQVSGDESSVLAVDASVPLTPTGGGPITQPGSFALSGTVYAGAFPAGSAVINLRDNQTGEDVATTASAADGSFSLSGSADASHTYTLRVNPYDADGDGVADYQTFSLNLGTLAAGNGGANDLNLSNLIVVLAKSQAWLAYVNFTPPLTRVTNPGTYNGYVLGEADADILLHFGAEVDVDSVQIDLVQLDSGVFDGSVNASLTWNEAATILTIDPAAPLERDSDPQTTYQIRIRGLAWSDGSWFVNPSNGEGGWLRIGFDVRGIVAPPTTPAPAPDLEDLGDALQTVTSMSCDSRVCWLLDADGAPFNGFVGTESTSMEDAFFNGASGLDIRWPPVAGAVSYRLYVHQTYEGPGGVDVAGWQRIQADIEIGLLGDDDVRASRVLSRDWGSPYEWDALGVGQLGDPVGNPLAFGNEVQIAVTAVDSQGLESPIVVSSALTLRDTTLARIVGASVFSGSEPPQEEELEKGFFGVEKTILVRFSEWMDAAADVTWTVYSGNIEDVTDPAAAVWDPESPTAREDIGESASFGPMSIDFRGACTEILEDAAADESAVLVRDASFFVAGDVFFLESGGRSLTGPRWRTLQFVDYGGGTLNFVRTLGADGGSAVSAGSFVCAAGALPGRSMAINAPGGSTLRLDDTSFFYPNQEVLIFGRIEGAEPQVVTATILRVRPPVEIPLVGLQDGALDLSTGINTYDEAIVMPRPLQSEVGFRQARELTLDDDALTGAEVEIPITVSSLEASTAMPGDLLLVDLDGDLVTVSDRYFAALDVVHMLPDNPSTGQYDPDFYVTLTAPPPVLRSLPDGLALESGTTRIFHLADSFRLTGGADTSGNTGFHALADQFSFCSGGSFCQNGIFVY